MELAAFGTRLLAAACDVALCAVAGCWDCVMDEIGDVTDFCAVTDADTCVGDGAVAVVSVCVVGITSDVDVAAFGSRLLAAAADCNVVFPGAVV